MNDQTIGWLLFSGFIGYAIGYAMAMAVNYLVIVRRIGKKRKRKYLPAERMFSHALVDAAEEYVSQLKHYNYGAIDRDHHVGPHMARAWKDLSDAACAHADDRAMS
jgi:uncharacterized membrane protein YccC